MACGQLQRRISPTAVATTAALWLLTASAPGCGDDVGPELGADASPSPDAEPAGRIAVPATMSDLELPFRVNLTGEGSERVSTISVLNAAGELGIFDQPTDVVVYERIDWTEVDRVLYQALAVAADRLYVVWFYCTGDELTELWVEGTDGTFLDWEPATGSCTFTLEPSSRLIELPAIDMAWPDDPTGFRLDGAQVQLDGSGPGWVNIDGVEMMLLPFERVDCTSCPPDGWYELHTLLWDEAVRRLCFGIFYLWPDDPGAVDFHYGFCLPDLQPIPPTAFTATWSAG